MSETQIGIAGIAALIALIAMRAPIGIALITVSFAGIWAIGGWAIAWGMFKVVPYTSLSNWTLSSIPMFLLMGFICHHCGLTRGLFEAAGLWFARLPGGLAIASVFGCTGFAAVTGSSVACAAAMGKVAVPEMVRRGYDVSLATGTLACAGTIGALIPPSILMILFGVVAQTSISQLFLGGIGVGLATAATYVIVILVRVWLNPALAPRITEHASWQQHLTAGRATWPVVLLIVGVLGGMFSGLFTATEAGAVGALLSIVIAAIKKTLTRDTFSRSVIETLVTCGSVFIVVIGASLLTRFLTLSGVAEAISTGVKAMNTGPVALLVAMTIVYLILGMFLEPIGALMITAPIFLPLVGAADINMIWFGVYVVKLLEIGMVTPPVGLNVFVLSSTVGKLASTDVIFRGVVWFFIADMFLLALLIAVPDIIMFIPKLFA
ncbi:MAG: TRAP transporter large permease subunit [Pseudomonadota bacterium]